MAVLTNNQVVKVWQDGLSDLAALYALRSVTATDTIDLSFDFSSVKRAVAMGTTVNGALAATFSGTVVTMPAGLSNDAGYLLVWGAHA